MAPEQFLADRFKSRNEFLAGLISIDIVGHSNFRGTEREKADTKAELASLITQQIKDEPATLLSWQGDGGIILFDIEGGCNGMVLLADRIRQLVPLFNRTRGILNRLPGRQEIIVSIICHAGMLVNKDGDLGKLSGDALNNMKRDKEIRKPGYIVLTSEIFCRMPTEMQDRCLFAMDHPVFKKVYILDGKDALTSVIYSDRASKELREWILYAVRHGTYDELLYFAYTNELLYEFLGFEVSDLRVKIVVRNWVVEKDDEDIFNRNLPTIQGDTAGNVCRRRWFKSELIKVRAKEIIENTHGRVQPLDMRFYDAPPLFNGAILTSPTDAPRAFVGISKWEEGSPGDGSPYKLEEWPAIVLDGRDAIHARMIEYLKSRFFQIWKSSHTYDDVCRQEANREARDPSIIGKVWALDEKPYLIVYPHRRVRTRQYPVVAPEDVMAFRLFELFLAKFRRTVKLQSFQVPDKYDGTKFPEQVQAEIDNWTGHVIYICTKSLSTALLTYLRKQGFPYDLSGMGTKSPALVHRIRKHWVLTSPTDNIPSEPRDYSIIAKFQRPSNKGYGYIAAGIRAMGTWGAAEYFTDFKNIQALSKVIDDNQFVATIETHFDLVAFKIISSKILTSPESFMA